MKNILFFLFFLITFLFFPSVTHAITNPLERPNNKFGIHILFPSELSEAAQLINSSGGDWGYVTIPIQSGDKDLLKWQSFMDTAKLHHLIPIVRLATEGDYFNTRVWRQPNDADIADFANFLDSLEWPTRNRYVMIFNEVNRADEWGGIVDPASYAEILSYAVTVFKSKNQNFYIISSGMDNAAPNQLPDYMDQYVYMEAMNAAVPGIFNQIDALSSHSYPNPGFSTPPSSKTTKSVASFLYERRLAESMSNKNLPTFITETGWSGEVIPDDLRAQYYKIAMETVWADPNIIAVTPFLLNAGNEAFKKFSFIDITGVKTKQYEAWKNMKKTKGEPEILKNVLSAESTSLANYPSRTFPPLQPKKDAQFAPSRILESTFQWMFKL